MPTGHCMRIREKTDSPQKNVSRTERIFLHYYSLKVSFQGLVFICHYSQLHWKLQGYWERWESMSALCHRENIVHEYCWSSFNLRSWLKVLLYDLQLHFLLLIDVVVAVWLPFCRMCLGLQSCKVGIVIFHVALFMVGWISVCKEEKLSGIKTQLFCAGDIHSSS